MSNSVGNVGSVGSTADYFSQYANSVKTAAEEKVADAAQKTQNPVDTYTPSVKGKDAATIQRLWKETDHAGDAVRKLVSSMLGKNDATGQAFWANRAKGGFKLSEADRAEAQKLVAEDGFFGVKQTTDRIMGFAKALVGEGAGEGEIEKMRTAVQKGFDEVSKMFGGYDNLPDVSKDTYEAIMKSFDDWKAGNIATA